MELSTTFIDDDWVIKYGLHGPKIHQAHDQVQLKTVVFVHGTPWSSDVFQPLAKTLLATGIDQVLLYDLHGYGRSQDRQNDQRSTPDSNGFHGDTSVRAQARALAALLQHLRLDGKDGRQAPNIIAHDIAGTIALRAHLLHGCEYASLLLMDTNTVLPWGDGFYKLVRSEPKTFLQLPSGIFEAIVRAVIHSACFDSRAAVRWEDRLARHWLSNEPSQHSFVRQIAQANDADVREMLDGNMYSDVRCPVKILWGEQDQWIPREKMNRLAELLGPSLKEFVAIPEAGHLVMIDQPERVAVEVFKFFEAVKTS